MRRKIARVHRALSQERVGIVAPPPWQSKYGLHQMFPPGCLFYSGDAVAPGSGIRCIQPPGRHRKCPGKCWATTAPANDSEHVMYERERRLMGEAIGVADAAILIELQLVGYRPDTIALLEVAPLLQIAWTDGTVSTRERDVIIQVAAREGVVYDCPAHVKLQVLLERPPPDDFFEMSLRAIQAMLLGLRADVRNAVRCKLVDNCTAVAVASGGFFGWRKISDQEQQVLDEITTVLKCAESSQRAGRESSDGGVSGAR